jgi:hypothetical protein
MVLRAGADRSIWFPFSDIKLTFPPATYEDGNLASRPIMEWVY